MIVSAISIKLYFDWRQGKEIDTLLIAAYSKIIQSGGDSYVNYPPKYRYLTENIVVQYSSSQKTKLISEAINDLVTVLSIDGSNKDIYYYLGRAYFDNKQIEEAERYWEMDIEKGSQHENSYVSLYAIYVDSQRFNSGIEVLVKYRKKYPNRSDNYHALMGVIEAKMGNFRKAIVQGKHLLQATKHQYPFGAYQAHTFLADMYQKIGDEKNHLLHKQLADTAKSDYESF